MALTVEVQWTEGTWTDATAQVVSVDVAHGAQRSGNPDRPAVQTASGHVELLGVPPAVHLRFRVRLRFGEAVLWSGLMHSPRELHSPDRGRWSLSSPTGDLLARSVQVSRAAGTAAEMLADTGFWSPMAPPATAHLPARALKDISYSGRLGGLLGRAALVSSGEVVERRDGSILVANPHQAALPAGSARIRSSAANVLAVTTRHLSQRVRNRGTVLIPGYDISSGARHEASATLTFRPTSGLVAAHYGGSYQVPTIANTTFSDWSARVVAVTGIGFTLVENRYQDDSGWGPYHRQVGQRTIAVSLPVTISEPSGGTAAITMTIPRNFRYSYQRISLDKYGRRTRETVNVTRSIGDLAGARDFALTAEITARRTTTQVVEDQFFERNNEASQSVWGIRELQLPYWISAENADILADQIDGLAHIRDEHTILLALDDATAAYDVGQYVGVEIMDGLRNIDIDAPCLILGRRITWRAGRSSPTVELRMLETQALRSVSAQSPLAPTGLTLTAGVTDIAASWTAGVGPAATSYDVQWSEDAQFAGPSTSSVASATGTAHTAMHLTPSTLYYLRVRARNASGVSPWVGASATTGALPRPPAIQNMVITPGDSQLHVSWDANPGVTAQSGSYQMQWGIQGNNYGTGSRSLIWAADPEATITGLSNGTTYFIRLRARNSAGNGPWQQGQGTPVMADRPEVTRADEPFFQDGNTANWLISWSYTPPTGLTFVKYQIRRKIGSAAIGAWADAVLDGRGTSGYYDVGRGVVQRFEVRAQRRASDGTLTWSETGHVQWTPTWGDTFFSSRFYPITLDGLPLVFGSPDDPETGVIGFDRAPPQTQEEK